jgi:hypothetical protein
MNAITIPQLQIATIVINNVAISLHSIDSFIVSKKELNDSNNKIRETIVQGMLENTIPISFYEQCNTWRAIKKSTDDFVEKLVGNQSYDSITVKPKGGRKFNYDFELTICSGINILCIKHIELKFNTKTVSGCPQFVSLGGEKMKNCLSNRFDIYFYENHLSNILNQHGSSIPPLETYTAQVNQPSPNCLKEIKEHYSSDTTFCQFCKQESAKAIANFIQETELNIEQLNIYLQETQKDKVYMMWHTDQFYIEEPNLDNYVVVSATKTKNSYQCFTQSGKTLIVLLRWKNGNGIAYPALQISEKKRKEKNKPNVVVSIL